MDCPKFSKSQSPRRCNCQHWCKSSSRSANAFHHFSKTELAYQQHYRSHLRLPSRFPPPHLPQIPILRPIHRHRIRNLHSTQRLRPLLNRLPLHQHSSFLHHHLCLLCSIRRRLACSCSSGHIIHPPNPTVITNILRTLRTLRKFNGPC